MGLLSRDLILGAADLHKELVPVPEWGGSVYVRTLPGTELDAFQASTRGTGGKPDLRNFRARLAALVCCDESGARLFSDADVVALGSKSGAALDRIADVAIRLNHMREDSTEVAEKNSASGPS